MQVCNAKGYSIEPLSCPKTDNIWGEIYKPEVSIQLIHVLKYTHVWKWQPHEGEGW